MMWYGVFGGFSIGTALALAFDSELFAPIAFCFALALFALWGRVFQMRIAAATLCSIAFGYALAFSFLGEYERGLRERTVFGFATVVSEPEMKTQAKEAVLSFEECLQGECLNTNVAAFFSAHESLHYGDRLLVLCPLQIPKNTEDFEYRSYLAARGIGFVCYPKEWELVQESFGGNFFVREILRFRRAAETVTDRFIPYPEAGLGKGLLFGGSGFLPQERKDDFSKTGMSHIVAVSGANVVLVSQSFFFLALALGLWRKQALAVSFFGIIGFVLMVGAGASSVRAGMMGSLVLAANYFGREGGAIRLLVLALAAMAWRNPFAIGYDLGLQLSFLATLGILTVMQAIADWLERSFSKVPAFLREILAMTLAAELFVMPLLLYTFHMFPLVSLAANMLVLPMIPLAMLFSFAAVALGFFWTAAGEIVGFFAYAVLHAMLGIVEFLASWKYAGIEWGSFGILAMAFWYAVLALWIVRLRFKV